VANDKLKQMDIKL